MAGRYARCDHHRVDLFVSDDALRTKPGRDGMGSVYAVGGPSIPSAPEARDNRAMRLLARALALWAIAVRGRAWWTAAGLRLGRRAVSPTAAEPARIPVPPVSRERSNWTAVLVWVGGFASYLAFVGGLLLWLRFRHAGVPPTVALSVVPPNQLITTAASELGTQVLPVVVILGVALASVLFLDRWTAPAPPRSRSKRSLPAALRKPLYGVVVAAAAVAMAGTLPLDPFGVVLCVSFVGALALGFAMRRITPGLVGQRRGVAVYLLVMGIFAALPVFARQVSDPLAIEGVRIERIGRPTVFGGLVAIRDGSVVIVHCGRLLVVASPADVQVVSEPSRGTSARSAFDRWGLRRDAPTPQPTRLC